ncbi:MAG: PQ-loop domain-containing transporter, partial [Flavobacteriaceae bacterium]
MNFGFIAAILTTSAFLPQALKTIRTRDTKSLSLMTF